MNENTPNRAQEMVDSMVEGVTAWSDNNLADGGVCDFCCRLLADRPVVTYTTNRPLIEHMLVIDGGGDAATLDHVTDEYWAACPACDPVIQKGDPEELARHVHRTADRDRTGVPATPGEMVTLLDLYARFFASDPQRSEGIPPELGEHS
jgi:hypothetical protein